MNRWALRVVGVVVVAAALSGRGCSPASDKAETPDQEAAKSEEMPFLDELKSQAYGSWKPAPGYEANAPAKGPHGDQVRITLNPVAAEALAESAEQWPAGSVIAKDIYKGGTLVQIAAMRKQADGWFWGEWAADGSPVVEGVGAEPCEGCHSKGTDGTLGVSLEQ